MAEGSFMEAELESLHIGEVVYAEKGSGPGSFNAAFENCHVKKRPEMVHAPSFHSKIWVQGQGWWPLVTVSVFVV